MQQNEFQRELQKETQKEILRENDLNIHVRCPDCFKSFRIDPLEIHEPRPKFKCSACEKIFWISLPESMDSKTGVIGYPVEWDQHMSQEAFAETSTEAPAPNSTSLQRSDTANLKNTVHTNFLKVDALTCPKCSEPYWVGEQECGKCGLVFAKYKSQELIDSQRKSESGFSPSPEVRQLWDRALEAYDNFEMHQNFITAAWADRSLDYAAYKYASILEVAPQDEFAKKAHKEILALVGTRFEVLASANKSEVVESIEGFSFFKDLDVIFRKYRWTALIMLACGVVITLGMLLPNMRNLVGFGSSILFFVIAMRFYFRMI